MERGNQGTKEATSVTLWLAVRGNASDRDTAAPWGARV